MLCQATIFCHHIFLSTQNYVNIDKHPITNATCNLVARIMVVRWKPQMTLLTRILPQSGNVSCYTMTKRINETWRFLMDAEFD